MRKLIFIVALAISALCSCSKNEETTTTDSGASLLRICAPDPKLCGKDSGLWVQFNSLYENKKMLCVKNSVTVPVFTDEDSDTITVKSSLLLKGNWLKLIWNNDTATISFTKDVYTESFKVVLSKDSINVNEIN